MVFFFMHANYIFYAKSNDYNFNPILTSFSKSFQLKTNHKTTFDQLLNCMEPSCRYQFKPSYDLLIPITDGDFIPMKFDRTDYHVYFIC